MPSAEFIAHARGTCAHLNSIGWENYYGTTASGNLPQYLVNDNPCGVNIEALSSGVREQYDIDESSFRYYHIKCPFSNESTNHYITDKNIYSPTFGQAFEIMPSQRSSHSVTQGIMIKHNRGSKYGWLCIDSSCPYFNGAISEVPSGSRYFYY